MKRAIPILIMLAAIAGGAFWYLRNRPDAAQSAQRAAELAPAGAVIFLEMPDVARTLKRWEETALRQISLEPEWQAFAGRLDEFLFSSLPEQNLGEAFALLKEADPASFFAAIMDPNAESKQYLVGFSYRGKKTAVKSAIERWKKTVAGRLSNVESVLTPHGETEIESVRSAGASMAFAYRDNWFFLASDVPMMRALLDRYSKPAGTLGKEARYLECLRQALPEADFHLYLNAEEMQKSQARAHAALMEEMKKNGGTATFSEPLALQPADDDTKAMFYSVKLEGRNMRSRLYYDLPKVPVFQPAAHRLAGFNGGHTLAYGAINLAGAEEWWWKSFHEKTTDLRGSPAGADALAAKGLKPADALKIFGPELSIHASWDPLSPMPSAFAAVELRDPAQARKYVEALVEQTSASAGGAPTKKEEHGTTFWFGSGGFLIPEPTMALNEKHLILSLDHASAVSAVKQFSEKNARFDQAPAFQAVRNQLPSPAGAVLHVDMARLVEVAYSKARPFIANGIIGNPSASKYLDAGKLPQPGIFTKHLGPLVATHANVPGGIAIESLGPLPLEATAIPAASAAAYFLIARPMMAPGGTAPAARLTRTDTDLEAIRTQLQFYEIRNGAFPSTEQGLKALVSKPAGEPQPKRWTQLLPEIPADSWGTPYQYRYPSTKGSIDGFDVFSAGEDKMPNTADDIGNW